MKKVKKDARRNTKESGSLILPLDQRRTSLMLWWGPWPNPGVIQFSMVGPRGGMLATAFPTPKMLRAVARELLKVANLLEGKEGLRLVKKRA